MIIKRYRNLYPDNMPMPIRIVWLKRGKYGIRFVWRNWFLDVWKCPYIGWHIELNTIREEKC